MADLSTTPVATQIKPMQQMSLGDIMNLASGAQSYKQTQQLNPIALEEARLRLAQTQAVNPLLQRQQQAAAQLAEGTLQPSIEQSQSQAQTAKLGTQSAQLRLTGEKRQSALNVLGTYMTHPDWQTDDLVKQRDRAADIYKELVNAGLSPGEALDQVTTLNLALAKGGGPAVQQVLKTAVQGAVSPETRLGQITPTLVTGAGGAPALFTPGSGQFSQPTYAGQPPAPGMPLPEMPLPGMPAPETPAVKKLPYPVTPIGSAPNRPMTMTEQADLTEGQKYRANLVNQQSSISQSQFNLDKVIEEASKLQESSLPTSGVAGAVRRKVAGWLGDPTYIQLAKDLANVEISNIRALGGSLDTVAGQQLMRMASGDETYPPEVLVNIANRAKANLTNIDLQAKAAQKFAQKYGDQNVNAFKQSWTANTDPKLFQAINIVNTEQNPQVRKKKLIEVIGSDPQALARFDKMYENTMRMVNSGELPR